MSDASWQDARPLLSAHVIVGPPMRIGSATAHYVKDGATGRFFRLGAREIYLLSLMDGKRSLRDIGLAYQDSYDLSLSLPAAGRLVQKLASRGLLEEGAQAATPIPSSRFVVKRYGEVYLRVLDPGRILGYIADRLKRVNPRWAVMTIGLVIGVCEAYALFNHRALSATISDSLRHPDLRVLGAFLAISYGAAALHELGHGSMCTYYGGRVSDMGLMFRYMTLFPYCKLDDLVILPSARARTVVVLAGVIVNLLLLLPFVILDTQLRPDSPPKQLCAYMLVVYNLGTLINLLPFLKLDGYLLISVCRGQPELRDESFQAVRRLFAGAYQQQGGRLNGYLLVYGALYAAVTVAAVCWAIFMWLHWSLGSGHVWAAALMPVLLLVLAVHHFRRRQARDARSPSA